MAKAPEPRKLEYPDPPAGGGAPAAAPPAAPTPRPRRQPAPGKRGNNHAIDCRCKVCAHIDALKASKEADAAPKPRKAKPQGGGERRGGFLAGLREPFGGW